MPVIYMDFPCVVYTRTHAAHPYRFSHRCQRQVQKHVPDTLHASCLSSFFGTNRPEQLEHEYAIILVGGDVAQGISADNMLRPDKRQRFLYAGSKYQTPSPTNSSSDLEPQHIELPVYSTFCSYLQGRFSASTQVLAGYLILPTELREREFVHFHGWLRSLIVRSIQKSRWITEDACYTELSGIQLADFRRAEICHPC